MAEQHYDVTVNKDDLSVRQYSDECNKRWADGWRLAQVFVKDANTVSVWSGAVRSPRNRAQAPVNWAQPGG